jgi:hypothetical protein
VIKIKDDNDVQPEACKGELKYAYKVNLKISEETTWKI